MISLTRSAARYVSKLSNKIRRKLDSFSAGHDFTGSQGRTLHFLLAQTEDVFQKDIEEEYSIRPSTATELLKQMEKNGLIRREPSENDHRLKKIVLTEKSLLYKQQVADNIISLEKMVTKDISDEDMEVFFRVIEKMLDNLS